MNIRDVVAGKHTKQEVVSFVFAKLAEQGRCSVEPGTRACRFRDQMGGKCAIGHLILDEDYRPAMDCGGVARVIFELGLEELTRTMHVFLCGLQGAHDRTACDVLYGESFRPALSRSFSYFCRECGLEMPKWPEG